MVEKVWQDPKAPPEVRARDLLGRMTPEEKLAQLGSVWSYELLEHGTFSQEKARQLLKNGIGQITRPGGATGLDPERVADFVNSAQRFLMEETRLGIPAIVHEECLAGLLTRGATFFPQPIAVASTWSPKLVETMATYIREQMKALGIHQGLAPVLDVARDPRWGRTEETFGEDPYLVACMGTAYVRGLQGEISPQLVATVKHFAGYSASEGGLNCAPSRIPERELREVFLFPFECAIREGGALSVMNSYSELDGIPCAASKKLLSQILRQEWGFQGIVVSDYFAIEMLHSHHRLARDKGEAARLALEAGIDVELPKTECYGAHLLELVNQGVLPEALLDAAVLRVLKLKFLLGLFERPFAKPEEAKRLFSFPASSEGRKIAREIARKSIVLLKNEGVLPLRNDLEAIAVIGPNAGSVRNLLGDYHYPAHLELFATRLTEGMPEVSQIEGLTLEKLNQTLDSHEIPSVLEAIKKRVGSTTKVLYAKGCDVTGGSRKGFDEAIQVAREANVAVLVVGDRSGLTQDCTSGETRDLASLKLPGVQEDLVLALAETGTPTVLVLICGRPYSLVNIVDKVGAVVVAWLPGEAGGEAVAEVLFGDVSPGGKLPISFPRGPGQLPIHYSKKPSGGRSHFWGSYVDELTEPLFPFGHGLSYTVFHYSDLMIEPKKIPPMGEVRVTLAVKNIGDREGEEVVQLYCGREFVSVTRPIKELKGFVRINLQPGEKKLVCFKVPMDVLAFYDEEMNLVVEPGEVKVMVGSSSEDIRLTGKFTIVGERRRLFGARRYLVKVEVWDDGTKGGQEKA